jgi:cytidyltransferase-like protein
MKKIVLATGGFDPIHSGHIEYLKSAKKLGDYLVVGLNSDDWLTRKKGRPFMPMIERAAVMREMSFIDQIAMFGADTDQDGSAKTFILETLEIYKDEDVEIIFANGGDRNNANIPEMTIQDPKLRFEFGVGGEHKMNSSSWILQEWKAPKTERNWGYWRVLHENGPRVKVKELTVLPGQRLSMQKHKDRSEHWFVSEGTATVYTIDKSTDVELLGVFNQHQALHISRQQWHQLSNEGTVPLKVVEIQYGDRCEEEDIERR